jgi:hypothetical protein
MRIDVARSVFTRKVTIMTMAKMGHWRYRWATIS